MVKSMVGSTSFDPKVRKASYGKAFALIQERAYARRSIRCRVLRRGQGPGGHGFSGRDHSVLGDISWK